MFTTYHWPLVGEFLDREEELARLDEWWASPERMPINLYGRRRVGKSWLLRRFADGKPAVLLVAERLAPGVQLDRFAEALEPFTGVRPQLPDVPSLFRVLFRVARERKLLAVVDEFPWLLPASEADTERDLSAIHAVFEEERDASRLKLVLCGSAVAQMEALLAERSPLHGRLVPLEVRPLRFAEATPFLADLSPVDRLERFALTGGMPRYLAILGRSDLRAAVCRQVLDRNGPLWNEARTIIEQELRQPDVYFSVLEQLAGGEKELNEIAVPLRLDGGVVAKYLKTLVDLRIVRRRLPVGAKPSARSGHWRLEDPFFRFWFRFVFPYQAELESGLRPEDLFDEEVRPVLSEHVAPVFEDWCREWARARYGRLATRIGSWWGPARHDLRRTGERQSEEIDIVGIGRGRVTLVGEAKWTRRKLGVQILSDLGDYKIPALRQAKFKVAERPRVVLFCPSGYSGALVKAAAYDESIDLIDVPAALSGAGSGSQP